MTRPGEPAAVPALAAWGAVLGLGLFALFRGRPLPAGALGPAGLAGAGACLAAGILAAGPAWRRELGLCRPRGSAAGWLAAAAGLGAMLGSVYRMHRGLAPWPPVAGGFLLAAAVIGAFEELVYRGFVQAGLRAHGRTAAMAGAAAAHAAYKCLLFAARPGVTGADLLFMATATFGVGLWLGAVREAGASAWPPITAHALFDVAVYGALDHAPWWVWDGG